MVSPWEWIQKNMPPSEPDKEKFMSESWMEAYLLASEVQSIVNKMIKSGKVRKSSVLPGLTIIQSLHEGHMTEVGMMLGVPEDRVIRGIETSREFAQRFARVILTSQHDKLKKVIDRMNELINNNEESTRG